MKPCCRTLNYLGDSPIDGHHLGQCSTCGSIRHGSKSNWRVKSSNGRMVMAAVKETTDAPKNRTLRLSTKAAAPVITIRSGMSVEDIITALRRQEVRIV
jgi:hypothetical protein